MAVELATTLRLPEDDIELIARTAPLHDVGKIGVPDQILLKPGRLTPQEFELVKVHTTIGAQILAGEQFPLLRMAERIALTHHERWDGTGYPKGLAGDSIPLEGRIVAVADVFDALINERPYKRAWPFEEAVAEIAQQRARQFDPDVVEAFLSVVWDSVPFRDKRGA
jgi:putative two-component system response regulator